jgi:hypothetical protein
MTRPRRFALCVIFAPLRPPQSTGIVRKLPSKRASQANRHRLTHPHRKLAEEAINSDCGFYELDRVSPSDSFALLAYTRPMQCPHCGLENPLEAIRCDRGYDFQTKPNIDRLATLSSGPCRSDVPTLWMRIGLASLVLGVISLYLLLDVFRVLRWPRLGI